jgi:hypothetical protein
MHPISVRTRKITTRSKLDIQWNSGISSNDDAEGGKVACPLVPNNCEKDNPSDRGNGEDKCYEGATGTHTIGDGRDTCHEDECDSVRRYAIELCVGITVP